MPRIYIARLSKYVTFPDGMPPDEITANIEDLIASSEKEEEPGTDLVGALQHGVKKIIPLAQQGFANQAEGVFNLLPYPDWAEAGPRKFAEQQRESAEDKLRRLEAEFSPDTLPEKIASGIAEAPGMLAPIAAPAAIAGILAPATAGGSLVAGGIGLGVPSFFGGYGETGDIKEGLKRGAIGAAEGAAFAGAGRLAGTLSSPIKKRLGHAVGGAVIGGTSAAAQGAGPEDIATAAATMFTLSGIMPAKERAKKKAIMSLEELELSRAKDSIAYKGPSLADRLPIPKEAKLWAQEKLSDVQARLIDVTETIKRDRELAVPPSQDPTLLGKRNSTAAAAQVRAGIEDGFMDTLDPRIQRTKPIAQIHKDSVPSTPSERNGTKWVEDYDAFLLANSVKEVRDRGIDFKGFVENPDMVISAINRKYSPETIAKWKRAQSDINETGNFAVDMLQRSGEFTAEQAASIKSRKNWVSLERYFEQTGDTRTGRQQGAGGKVIHKLTGGSGQKLMSPYVTTMSLMERAYVRANQNYYFSSLFDIYGQAANPELYFKPVKTVKFVKGLPKQLKDGPKKQSVAAPRERFNDAENIVTFKRDGKSVSYQLEPKLYNALKKGERFNVPRPFEMIMGGPKRLATLGYTGLNPGFSIFTNPQRDLFSSMLQSADPGIAGFGHLKRLWETSAGRAMERGEGPLTESARNYRGSGAKMAGPVAADMSLGITARDRIIQRSERFGIARDLVKHPLEALRELTGMSEDINRLPEYLLMEKKYGANTPNAHIAGMAAAKDVSLDFSRMGEYTRWANEAIPFFNAAFQGASKFGRTLKERPVAATLQGMGMITAPMLGLWAINKDEQWYQELPTWEKTLFAHIKLGDGPIWRIPLPFEWGILFGSLPVAVADSVYQKDPQRFYDGTNQAIKTLIPDFTPQFIRPVAENWANEDMFKGRKIESESMKRRLPQERYTERTPELYKGLGALTGSSPVKIQHLAESYTGGLIKEPVNMIDFLMGKEDTGGIPFASRLTSSENRQGQSVDDFYTQREEMGQAWTSAKKRQEAGDILGARRILEDNAKLLGLSPGNVALLTRSRKWTIPERMKRFNTVANQMSQVRKRKGESAELTNLARLAIGRN